MILHKSILLFIRELTNLWEIKKIIWEISTSMLRSSCNVLLPRHWQKRGWRRWWWRCGMTMRSRVKTKAWGQLGPTTTCDYPTKWRRRAQRKQQPVTQLWQQQLPASFSLHRCLFLHQISSRLIENALLEVFFTLFFRFACQFPICWTFHVNVYNATFIRTQFLSKSLLRFGSACVSHSHSAVFCLFFFPHSAHVFFFFDFQSMKISTLPDGVQRTGPAAQ